MNQNFYWEFPNLKISPWCSLFRAATYNLYSLTNVPFYADKSTKKAFVNSGLISIKACLLDTEISLTCIVKFGFLPITVYLIIRAILLFDLMSKTINLGSYNSFFIAFIWSYTLIRVFGINTLFSMFF
jgi:hypothetical protein